MRIGRVVAARTAWGALRRARRTGGPGARELFGAVPRMARLTLTGQYRGISRGRLALMGLAVAYLLSPIDLMPEMALLVLGLGDDALVLGWLLNALLVDADAFLAWERSRGHSIQGETVR